MENNYVLMMEIYQITLTSLQSQTFHRYIPDGQFVSEYIFQNIFLNQFAC